MCLLPERNDFFWVKISGYVLILEFFCYNWDNATSVLRIGILYDIKLTILRVVITWRMLARRFWQATLWRDEHPIQGPPLLFWDRLLQPKFGEIVARCSVVMIVQRIPQFWCVAPAAVSTKIDEEWVVWWAEPLLNRKAVL